MTSLHLARKALLSAVAASALVLSAGCKDPAPTPPLQGQVHLTLLHTGDIHSRLFPYNLQLSQINAGLGLGSDGQIVNIGGAARISHIIGRERARSDRVLHLDCGDSFEGAPVFNFFNGEPEIRTISAMGADASLVGNHEFDHGALNLGVQLQKWANYPALAANYILEDPTTPGASPLASIVVPFTVFDLQGLRVAAIGMGNLSSLGSIYDQPNRLGVTPLNTTETAQFYVDLLRPLVDVVVVMSHLGLDYDTLMIQQTTGIDVVLGSHNHIVLQPPETLQDCGYSELNPDGTTRTFVLVDRPNAGQADVSCTTDADCGTDGYCYAGPVGNLGNPQTISMGTAICKAKRDCTPRNVLLAQSGAFTQFVGRLDLIVSNAPADLPPSYDPINGFEVISNDYQLFPVTDQTPDDPVVAQMLEPYSQGLDALGNLSLLVGYALDGSDRNSTAGGDSPLGNLIATAMWQRVGIQTDFALTNTTGIRTNLVPGPVTIEQMYNIFPFDNSITKMNLSGYEVQELFDYTAQRSATRGCVSQVQVAGMRVVMDCTLVGPFDESMGNPGIATHIYIGPYLDNKGKPLPCSSDMDCPDQLPNQCDVSGGICYQPIQPINSYDLATSDYLAGGGSGFITLKANTTQINTHVEQRDAFIDYIRAGPPCGADADGSLPSCSFDTDCVASQQHPNLIGTYVCACAGAAVEPTGVSTACTTGTLGCAGKGSCVLQQCRDDVAAFNRQTCLDAPNASIQQACESNITPCAAGGEQCKFLACLNQGIGNFTDGRIQMVGQ
jgi:5'-nucleotidase